MISSTPSLTMDRHLFTQIGLDSARLTLLGSVVHSFAQAGNYRCVVHDGPRVKAVFIVTADPESPQAQATVDVAALAGDGGTHATRAAPVPDPRACCCAGQGEPSEDAGVRRYTVNPRGHVLFRVGAGAGGYYVHARRIDADADDRGYDTRSLVAGDVFAAVVLRPGRYTVHNRLDGARASLVVAYPPPRSEKRYQPPPPLRVQCGRKAFEPGALRIDPGQGLLFDCVGPAHIEMLLDQADDGPTGAQPRRRRGLTRAPDLVRPER